MGPLNRNAARHISYFPLRFLEEFNIETTKHDITNISVTLHNTRKLGKPDIRLHARGAPAGPASASGGGRKKRDSRRVKFWNGPKRQRELSIPAVPRSIEADETMPIFLVKGLVER